MDGLMVEVHHSPKDALSDSDQQITPGKLISLLKELDLESKAVTPRELQKLIIMPVYFKWNDGLIY